MALLTWEGFDQFDGATSAAVHLVAKGWATILINSLTTGRYGGRSVAQVTNAVPVGRWDFASAIATATVGVAFLQSATNAAARDLVTFCDSGNTAQFGLGINTSNKLIVWRGTPSTVVATSTTATITNSQWYYLEIQATIHNTTGAYEVRLNGAQVADLTATGVNTRNTSNNQTTGILIGAVNSSPTGFFYWDDVYITDTSGGSNTGFLGECRVQTIVPTGAGASAQFTASAGSNWQNVDEIGASGAADNTDYNSSSTAGHVDSLAITSTSITGSPTIYGIALCMTARKDDVGTRTMRTRLKSSSAVSTGTTQTLLASYYTYRTAHLTDPNTSAAWTASGVNAMELGYELVA